ncbi:MAG: hypothetical protein JXB49_23535 [Bacteroidales bacterium]|nr:hypothetical protein [Bacteroidales bacterium]
MKHFIFLVLLFLFIKTTICQNYGDSLVRSGDLRFQSNLEKFVLYSYVKYNTDTFELFMAIDNKVDSGYIRRSYVHYLEVLNELNQRKVAEKKMNKRIKATYTIVHDQFLKKYNDEVYFPELFKSGIYNCVTASILYAMVFDRMNIPYKVMASSNHVYLVANPGEKSVVIETTNPGFEKMIFTGEFKQQYVEYLRNSKLISDSEYKNKSVEEIFEEKYNEVKQAEFCNLFGIQYYNKALECLNDNKIKEGYELAQKAYYFFPDQQVKTLLFTALVFRIKECAFDEVSDIDYLSQLSRFENVETEVLVGLFGNVIANNLQYTNKEAFCDSIHQRLVSNISDEKQKEEISFTYYMQMSYRYQGLNKVENYVYNALKIKGNHYDANTIMTNYIHRVLGSLSDAQVLLDSVVSMQAKYNFENIQSLLHEYKMIAYLKMAEDSYSKNNSKKGDEYLGLFEENCVLPISNPRLIQVTEIAYHNIAVKLFYKNKIKAKNIVNRGMEFVPYSRLIKSAVY